MGIENNTRRQMGVKSAPNTQSMRSGSLGQNRNSLRLPLIGGRVPDLGRLKMKPFKHPPNVRVVVDADHHLPLTTPHKISHALVVFEREVDAVPRRLPVRRVHVVEGVWPVVALCTLKPL